jgi:phage gp45-like
MSLRDRLVQLLNLGRSTTAATDGGTIRTVQLRFPTALDTRDRVPFMQHYGFSSRPHPGCDFAVIALDQHPAKSVLIASNDQRYRIALAEGESAVHDDQQQAFHITRSGLTLIDKSGNTITTTPTGVVITDASGSTVTMEGGGITLAPDNLVVSVTGEIAASGNAGTGMTVDGDLNVTGDIHATGDIIAGFGSTNISVLGHLHTSESAGSPTSPPITGT